MASEPENVADVGNRKSYVLTLAITLTVRFLGKMFNLKRGGRQTSHPPLQQHIMGGYQSASVVTLKPLSSA